mmetsp:Transcript_25927/g.36142  ORF Transcript_25927/g.36142 Transcript_25927/m.36142 type:complete len:90 (-) Transcript_25927:695-964(-)
MGVCSSNDNIASRQLVRVGYRSTMKSGDCIDEIIKKAEKKNRTLKVGGALWYDPETNKVHQILEGEVLHLNSSKMPEHHNTEICLRNAP